MDRRTAEMLAERDRRAAAAPVLFRLTRLMNGAKSWIKAHQAPAIIASVASVVVLLWAYQVLVARPAEHRAKTELETRSVALMKVETTSRSVALEDCLTKTKAEADARWNAACRKRGQGKGCALSARQTEALQQEEGRARNGCLMRYSVATQ